MTRQVRPAEQRGSASTVIGHIVVLRALGLGDLLTAVPALRALRGSHPTATISLAAPQWLAPLVTMIDAVDRLLPTEELAALPHGAAGAGLAVNLHGRGPQSTARLAETAPRSLLAFAHPDLPCTAGGPRWDDAEHEVRRWCRLLEHAGMATDAYDLRLDCGTAPSRSGGAAPVVLHLGASAPARRWPARRWAAVAAALAGDGHPLVLTGAAEDRPAAEVVRRAGRLPGSCSLVGRTTLAELAGLVARAALVVVGDTGVAHLASAFGTPSVILFGPVSPARWGPPPGPHRVLWAGCLGDPHAQQTDPGLLRITADAVLAEARSALSDGDRGSR